ncbi:ribonuclease HI [Catenuloplanes nepalensis]|uniref:Ribonuclease HI n=1 Tax=Catenuloplanes nepalensis TaxID=587533 RepID=A0ABT9MV77_9ACTN|nr:hypothetical protein [Catenuloplanes nepalensis]MDP9795352.1 ribonuclease HI [Catenuloplanes nepalensis]
MSAARIAATTTSAISTELPSATEALSEISSQKAATVTLESDHVSQIVVESVG